ncbi:hypothetical protein [Bradyrhizobium erythrophlei]|uniref:hypothetical protein n=1 Tax=Bradyrhizobium erythrophlei TaxID=1437360 RepID=UPI000B891380|nr:hypothetical protein [Bradyrhizobium erythrophlei]
MPITSKPLEIPPELTRKFADNMRAFHAEDDPLKRDGIAADTRHILLEQMPKGTKLRLAESGEVCENVADRERPVRIKNTSADAVRRRWC